MPTNESLADFPVVVTIPVSWGDMDAFGHVNNVHYLRWFEDARIAYFARIHWMDPVIAAQSVPILARTSAVYRHAIRYPDTVHVGARVTVYSHDRFTMVYTVYSEQQNVQAALGEARIISVKPHGGGKTPLPPEILRELQAVDLMAKPA